MLNKLARGWISKITRKPVIFNCFAGEYTSFRIGGPVDAVVFPHDIGEITQISEIAADLEVPLIVLGGGSNTLIRDRGIRGIMMIVSGGFGLGGILEGCNKSRILKVPAGIATQAVCSFSIRNSLSGINFALGIPGTIGGAIAMNAGTNESSMSDVLRSVTILTKNGRIERLLKPFNEFSYRDWSGKKKKDIILECEIGLTRGNPGSIRLDARRLIVKRKKLYPIEMASAGCFFKNPGLGLSAGELIDKVGLKGTKIGGAVISRRHANFILNINNATASDVLKLADLARELVYKCFHITLEPEVNIVGN